MKAAKSSSTVDDLPREFAHRRQVALKCGYEDVTGRLIGFVRWMRTVPIIARLLKHLVQLGRPDELMFEKRYGTTVYCREHIDARSIEEIAAVGLALIDRAEKIEQPLYEVGPQFGIRSHKWNPLADSEAVVSRYVIPFVDQIEQRLPQPAERSLQSKIMSAPAIIFDSLRKFRAENRKTGGRCFVMMRFGDTAAHTRIENTIKNALTKHGLVGLLARDKEFHDDLFPNILTYMHGCDFGIAVFERLETEVFNPNVALEVGYMLGLKKPVLLLKIRHFTRCIQILSENYTGSSIRRNRRARYPGKSNNG
jgi:hypothetical protein